ncbi:hypothetical protein BDDG_06341 [Blastomyces dermatitidis ATCC 18188]|uniref:Centromere protein H C-terminal domain-containing protein n=1 Tax=Ajellomyces dermatitidis (strain ATCC 18188 / CBS 674.68) TaxID=653446 RepID=F2TJI4_AJEDA|nr:hypothetical protein BDDG_06341 [Blastomyces dermatitidis ATCC 18188]
MAPGNEVPARSHPQLEPHEATLLELAGTTSARDIVSLSRKELQVLELYDRIQEQELETALLSQDYTEPALNDDDIDIEEQLATAERELLEARSTYSVKRKAIEAVLMADPSIQSVHAVSGSPAERALLHLINRRDLLSLIYTNLSRAHASCTQSLSTAKVDSIHSTAKNQKLVQTLLGLTSAQTSWREGITDQKLRSQLETLEKETKAEKANWVTIKRIVSAAIVASGVDWAADEQLHDLVVDDDDDDDVLDDT